MAESGQHTNPTSFEAVFPYDVFNDKCPTRLVLDRIADKWAMLLLDRLQAGPMRFNQIRRDIMGISQKMLSQTLKKLERDGLVLREVKPTVPVTVKYGLTALGMNLTKTLALVAHWAEENMDQILEAQNRYDQDREDDDVKF